MGLTYVLGAGTEYGQGVPIISNLATELMAFEENYPGLCTAMRRSLKGMRFQLKATILQDASEYFKSLFLDSRNPERLIADLTDETLKPGKEEAGTIFEKYWRFLYRLAEKSQSANSGLFLDEDLKAIIEDIADIGVMDYKLIKDGHIVPSYSIETALSKIFEAMILKRGEEEGGAGKIDKLKDLILGSKWNVERMLAEYFQGFYQGNQNKQKIYAYLSWLLWFYFRVKQITAADNINMFYNSVAKTSVEDSKIYTFNYTKLAELSGLKNVTHVHGDLDRYYNYATRVGAKLPNPKGTPEEEVENLTHMIQKLLSFDKNLINLPTLVPPLLFKPMLSLESIRSYYSFYEHMVNGDSDKCIVAGFSYSDTDTHLNMLFRHFGGTTFHLNPDADTPKKIASLKGIKVESVMSTYVADIAATQVGQKDIFIPLKAEEVTPELLVYIAEHRA